VGLRQFNGDGIADLHGLIFLGAGKDVVPGEAVGGRQLMRLQEPGPHIDTVAGDLIRFDQQETVLRGDGIQRRIEGLADAGGVILHEHLHEQHVLLGDDGLDRSIHGAGAVAVAALLVGLDEERLHQTEVGARAGDGGQWFIQRLAVVQLPLGRAAQDHEERLGVRAAELLQPAGDAADGVGAMPERLGLVAGEDGLADQTEINTAAGGLVRAPAAGAVGGFGPDDGFAVAASHEDEAAAAGGIAKVGGGLDLPFHGVAEILDGLDERLKINSLVPGIRAILFVIATLKSDAFD